ncbi:stress response protein nhax [Plakobranchus ocellatus]|uniref:Stress response protein nhax n=1 Tax=Plakobranchus ocellatus TaxID=259542 RepID=A0AAV4C9X2_9GAST|nr:stress response protein nhax [Plakobranchus ocellatus]
MASAARRLMICMDGSEEADKAFEWYLNHFYKESDYVNILYCAEHGVLQAAPVPAGDPSLISKLANEEEGYIIRLLKNFQSKLVEAKKIYPNIKGTVQRVTGKKPGEQIVTQAQKHHVDLIIMGSRGLGTIRRTIMGSVSQYVVHYARVPVMVIRNEES